MEKERGRGLKKLYTRYSCGSMGNIATPLLIPPLSLPPLQPHYHYHLTTIRNASSTCMAAGTATAASRKQKSEKLFPRALLCLLITSYLSCSEPPRGKSSMAFAKAQHSCLRSGGVKVLLPLFLSPSLSLLLTLLFCGVFPR